MKIYVTHFLSACFLLLIGCSTSYDVDLLITNAEIYDGSGSPSYLGQVGVKDGKIVKGMPEAPNKNMVDKFLQEQGLKPIDIYQQNYQHLRHLVNTSAV